MSFASDVKSELLQIDLENDCCMLAQLSAILRMNGDFVIRRGSFGINFATENAALARQVLKSIKKHFQVTTEVVVTRSQKLRKNNRYQLKILPAPEVGKLVDKLRLHPADDGRIEHSLLISPCCRRAFLRGVFLASGSVNTPEAHYHLEIVTHNENFVQTISRLMKHFKLHPKITDRKNEYVVYLKEGDAIVRFLSVIGAHDALLKFENVRVVKQMRNQVNRLVNCETANLDKTIQAAFHQVECIRFLEQNNAFDTLPPKLKEIALLRLEHPEGNLSELVAIHGELSKSGMNHRLKKLENLASELGMRKQE